MSKSFTTMLLVCLPALLLSSCGKTGTADVCSAFVPVYIDGTDAISDGTARPILNNDETGHKLCGWEYSTTQVEGTADNHTPLTTN